MPTSVSPAAVAQPSKIAGIAIAAMTVAKERINQGAIDRSLDEAIRGLDLIVMSREDGETLIAEDLQDSEAATTMLRERTTASSDRLEQFDFGKHKKTGPLIGRFHHSLHHAQVTTYRRDFIASIEIWLSVLGQSIGLLKRYKSG
jgi:hypothetical protein